MLSRRWRDGCRMPKKEGNLKKRKKIKLILLLILISFLLPLALTLTFAAPGAQGEAQKITIPRNSPVPSDPASIAAGAKFFTDNCIGCHGRRADGKGVVARNLDPKPRNLRNALWITAKSDGYLFRSITYGVPGTSMPPWGPVLSEKDRWNLINYLRSLTALPKQAAAPPAGERK